MWRVFLDERISPKQVCLDMNSCCRWRCSAVPPVRRHSALTHNETKCSAGSKNLKYKFRKTWETNVREEILIIWKKEDLNFSFVTISPLICTFNLASQRRVLTCFGWHWMVVLEKAALHSWCIIAWFVIFVNFVSTRAFSFRFCREQWLYFSSTFS